MGPIKFDLNNQNLMVSFWFQYSLYVSLKIVLSILVSYVLGVQINYAIGANHVCLIYDVVQVNCAMDVSQVCQMRLEASRMEQLQQWECVFIVKIYIKNNYCLFFLQTKHNLI